MNSIKAFPTKRFFVQMLTRDIDIKDAILDLLDNCVDGILRSIQREEVNIKNIDKPYEGFFASIIFDKNSFVISDNCGGIPKKIAQDEAFMMGKEKEVDEHIPTVGMYGIGMKRAIFKMGKSCKVISETRKDGRFSVDITPAWMTDNDKWELEMENLESKSEYGTQISISDLHPTISQLFDTGAPLRTDLHKEISIMYSLIIQKGFKVDLNGKTIEPQKMVLMIKQTDPLTENHITPYIYKGEINDVKISLAVGFYRGLLSEEEEEGALKERRSTEQAGWTIICNDRVVLYNDKTILTGWGANGVPNYHTQFIGIFGVVFFQSDDATKLPLTTTKRSVEASSSIYLTVKNYMCEGTKKFTDYTNHWKGNAEMEQKNFKDAVSSDIMEILNKKPTLKVDGGKWNATTQKEGFKLNLPLAKPPRDNKLKTIKFTKHEDDIDTVKDFLYDPDTTVKPSDLGEYCFNYFLQEAKKTK